MKQQNSRRTKPVALANSRWAAYAAAGAATALGGATTVEADITYSGLLNQVFNNTINVPFSLGAAGNSFRLTHQNTDFAGFFINGAVAEGFLGSGPGAFRYPSRLALDVPVSGAFIQNNGTFFATLASIFGSSPYGNFLAPGIGFIGFQFNTGAGMQFGWIRLNMDGVGANNTFTLVDYAFGGPGEAIRTGQIPEPGSLALLAVGAVGILVWRNRRAQKAA